MYLGVVQRVLVLFAFASLGAGCGGASVSVPPVPPAPNAPLARGSAARPTQKPAPRPALASRCHAAPSTVYGNEAVAFEIDGAASRAVAEVELLDQHGGVVAKGLLELPGQWRPPSVPSGDFRLQVGGNRVSCTVTVNRELSRASQPSR